jgi:cell division protein FtsI/penicillin-binding protein 2
MVGQNPEVPVMRRPIRLTAALSAAALLAGLVACSHQAGPESAVSAFLAGWQKGQFDSSLHLISADGAAAGGADVAAKIKKMAGDLAAKSPTLKSETPKVQKNDASAVIDVAWPIATGVTWTYQTTLRLHLNNGTWNPIWEPSVFQPAMKDTDKLTLNGTDANRGSILDGGGQPIFANLPVVTVGIQPNLVKGDLNALITTLDDAFKSVQTDVDVSSLANQVKAAQPAAFVQVATLRQATYDQIRSKIHDLNGTVFQTGTMPLAPTKVFAHALLGTVGDVTKERMDAKPGKYQIGDQVGFGGLQETYDDRLRGAPAVSVALAGAPSTDGTTTPPGKVLFHTDPVAGQPIKTTIDQRTQNAADSALTGTTLPASLVAIRISDGAILAVANGPGASGNDLGLTGSVPPGSMFKAVTATNLLETGKVNINTMVNCPAALNVGGRSFTNSNGEVLGNVPLHQDFAQSCNTAFASLAPQLGPTGLKDTAAQLGIGVPWDLGVNEAFSGSVSANGDAIEQAAAAFGQGRTLVSPVAMAAAAAALARGQWKQPHLVLDPAPAKPAADQAALKQPTVDAMHQMMREVVTDGTAKADKGVPGAPIYGKTGTAEYDNDPAHAHSWFMGFRGDIAFAVFVQSGGLSTAVAVPIAGRFFTTLG